MSPPAAEPGYFQRLGRNGIQATIKPLLNHLRYTKVRAVRRRRIQPPSMQRAQSLTQKFLMKPTSYPFGYDVAMFFFSHSKKLKKILALVPGLHRSFNVKFACFSPCLDGFPPSVLVSPHQPKTCPVSIPSNQVIQMIHNSSCAYKLYHELI